MKHLELNYRTVVGWLSLEINPLIQNYSAVTISAPHRRLLQRTELRAFGHFVSEVLELFAKDGIQKTKLQNVANTCREDSAGFAKVNKEWKEVEYSTLNKTSHVS
jgi:hypothetical protein